MYYLNNLFFIDIKITHVIISDDSKNYNTTQ